MDQALGSAAQVNMANDADTNVTDDVHVNATNDGHQSKNFTLYELIPKFELNLPKSQKILGKNGKDNRVIGAFHRAIGGRPTKADAGWLFHALFEHVTFYLHKRPTHGRTNYWRSVTAAWEASSGVILDVEEVRLLVLTITLAERMWFGQKTGEVREFLRLVRWTNDYFVRSEYQSDEAQEIMEGMRADKPAHAFCAAAKQPKITWATFTPASTQHTGGQASAPVITDSLSVLNLSAANTSTLPPGFTATLSDFTLSGPGAGLANPPLSAAQKRKEQKLRQRHREYQATRAARKGARGQGEPRVGGHACGGV